MSLPQYHELFNDVIHAMKRLGGSASLYELDEEVIKNRNLSEDEIAQIHGDGKSEIQYRLAWTRTYLKIYGILENTVRKIWVLTTLGKNTENVDPQVVIRYVRSLRKLPKSDNTESLEIVIPTANESIITRHSNELDNDLPSLIEPEQLVNEIELNWREELLQLLYAIQPDGFERLCQRILRESGFVEVTVTGRSGDGGIDGVGIIRMGGLLNFPVIFQCKRYKGSVGSPDIRNFRGAMAGRTDRGIFITTGTFSREAIKEAKRDGVPTVDLINGEQLTEKLKELRLGLEVKLVEEIIIKPDFFKDI